MKSTFSVIYYLKRQVVKKDGTVPVMGRITYNRQNEMRRSSEPDATFRGLK